MKNASPVSRAGSIPSKMSSKLAQGRDPAEPPVTSTPLGRRWPLIAAALLLVWSAVILGTYFAVTYWDFVVFRRVTGGLAAIAFYIVKRGRKEYTKVGRFTRSAYVPVHLFLHGLALIISWKSYALMLGGVLALMAMSQSGVMREYYWAVKDTGTFVRWATPDEYAETARKHSRADADQSARQFGRAIAFCGAALGIFLWIVGEPLL